MTLAMAEPRYAQKKAVEKETLSHRACDFIPEVASKEAQIRCYCTYIDFSGILCSISVFLFLATFYVTDHWS